MAHKIIQIKNISVSSTISQLTGPTNCIVIWRKDVAVVVDPGGEGEKIARFLKRQKLTVGAYWLTHAHPDHVAGLSELFERFPAPIRYHRADSLWIKFWFPIFCISKSEWLQPFENIRIIKCADIVAKVILTPGHSRGSVCYWFDKDGFLLTGDTLMRGYIGATIFPGGNSKDLNASLQKVFCRIPDDTRVFPGHGCGTIISAERN